MDNQIQINCSKCHNNFSNDREFDEHIKWCNSNPVGLEGIKKEIKQSKEIPIIEVDYKFHFTCPECKEWQEIEGDAGEFYPVICEECNTEFSDYKKNF